MSAQRPASRVGSGQEAGQKGLSSAHFIPSLEQVVAFQQGVWDEGYRIKFTCPAVSEYVGEHFAFYDRESRTVNCDYGEHPPALIETAMREVASRPLAEVRVISPEVPPLPSDIEVCPDHKKGPPYGQRCWKCEVAGEQVRLWARNRAREREALANASPDAWLPLDLTDAPDLPEPSILEMVGEDGRARPVLRAGTIAGVHGASQSGKTHLAYLGLAQQVRAGHLGLLIDYEMGPTLARAALHSVGLSDEEIRQGLLYYYDPPVMSDQYFGQLMDRIERHQRELTFGVIDSVSRSMGKVPGASTNDEMHVNAWYDSLPRRIRWELPDFTAFTIDHPGKSDGPDPIGSHAKVSGPDVGFWLENKTKFDPHKGEGRSLLHIRKYRMSPFPMDGAFADLSVVDRQLTFRALAGEHGTDLEIDNTNGVGEGDAARAAIIARLFDAGADGLLTKEAVGCESGGAYQQGSTLLGQLHHEGKVINQEGQGKNGQGVRWFLSPPKV